MLKKEFSNTISTNTSLTWDESNKPTKAINNGKNTIKPTLRNRQLSHKIHRHMCKRFVRIFNRLQKPPWLLRTTFISLTNRTLTTKLLYSRKHVLPIKALLGKFQQLLTSKMSSQSTGVQLRQHNMNTRRRAVRNDRAKMIMY